MAVDYRGQPITQQTAFTTTGLMEPSASNPMMTSPQTNKTVQSYPYP